MPVSADLRWRIAGWAAGASLVGVAVGAGLIATLAGNASRPPLDAEAVVLPTLPAPPGHNYSSVVGNMFAYPVKPRPFERQQGMTSRDLQPLLVRYAGKVGDSVQFVILAPSGQSVTYECAPPFTRCEMDARPGWTEVAPGTILDAVLADVRNGYLSATQPAER